jgi:hypothetical protein
LRYLVILCSKEFTLLILLLLMERNGARDW